MLAIGDFSRITHLSIRTLRHYHEVGLLEPAAIDPSSGYRHYTLDQVPIAQVIRRFRDLDMPVDRVREVLASECSGDAFTSADNVRASRLTRRVSPQSGEPGPAAARSAAPKSGTEVA